ncbi:Golgi-associated plant pathogenesis-related protein 1-like isoform X2 [Mytilus californianus]|uniref:Golgi-associated plant pathogenesis-related protein 1-like isoform X2 n=1 Tax=Mytilus californianus TaxID=6549 RepID=UPI002246839A|nr:Golgi-associated plant pathogenesis-related protein 1-like isoform X2 [Mytilus californianus]
MGGKSTVPEIKKDDWKDTALRAHNKVRKLHNAPPLKYSKDLSMYAQNHALYLKTKTKVHRSGMYCQGEHIGENIAERILPASVKEYGECRNFTQLIWKDTKEVGFGMTVKGRRVIVVACYKPVGNIKGKYPDNVLPRLVQEQSERRFSKCLSPRDNESDEDDNI